MNTWNHGIHKELTRRSFLCSALAGPALLAAPKPATAPVVSVVRIKNDNIQSAVEQAIDLLGGIKSVAREKSGSC